MINWLSAPQVRSGWATDIGDSFELALCLEPVRATATWRTPDGVIFVETFGSDEPRPSPMGLRHEAVVPNAVLLLAAELWEAAQARLDVSSWPNAIP